MHKSHKLHLSTSSASKAFQVLAPTQRGMLIDQLSGAAAGTDIEQMVVSLAEPVNTDRLRAAWQRVLGRHDVLRASFRVEGSETHWRVHPDATLDFEVHDWRDWPAAKQSQEQAAFLLRDRERGFDLTAPSAMRVNVLLTGDDGATLVWTVHHVLCDGRAMRECMTEMFRLYDAADPEAELSQLPEPVSLAEHTAFLAELDPAPGVAHFVDVLDGLSEPTPLPFHDSTATALDSGRGNGEVEWTVDAEQVRALSAVAEAHGATLNNVLQAAWSILLARHAGSRDVAFGGIRACRRGTVDGADRIVGCLMNTVPVRARLTGEMRLGDLLQSLRAQWLKMRPYENTCLADIHAASEFGSQPLFESFVVFEGYSLQESLEADAAAAQGGGGDSLAVSKWKHRRVELLEQSGLPLSLAVNTVNGGLECWLAYARERLSVEQGAALKAHFCQILAHIAGGAQTVAEVTMLSDAETEELMTAGTGERLTLDPTEQLHDCVFNFARTQPTRVAMRDSERVLTYRELALQADAVAEKLIETGTGPGDRVGISGERTLEFAACMLGILRAGAAYVPIDADYPAERVAHIIHETRVSRVLLANGVTPALPDDLDVQEMVLSPASSLEAAFAERPVPVQAPAQRGKHAYVLFTSGSTGLPKGVLTSHQAVHGLLKSAVQKYGHKSTDVCAQTASISFDTSVEEFFSPWLVGAEVVIRPDGVMGARELRDWADRYGVTVMDLPTAYFHEWINSMEATGVSVPEALRLVIVGGEKASAETLKLWRRRVGDRIRWVNSYGPTETSIVATQYEVSHDVEGAIPIGRPYPNVHTYLMDALGGLSPKGCRGEICIGGVGLAEEYLNQPLKTKQSFVTVQVGGVSERVYRTGDLGYWENGEIMYAGRGDDQVKVNGYRVELGEVTGALQGMEGVQDAAVLFRGGRLAGFYTTRDPDLDATTLRKRMGQELPAYMRPATLKRLAELPMTPNGKVDKKALASMPEDAEALVPGQAPRTATELTLRDIVQDVTGISHVGVTHGFDELGITSLKAIRILDELNGRGIAVNPAALLKNNSVEKLAEAIDTAQAGSAFRTLVPLRTEGDGPRLFLFHSMPGDILGYGQLVQRLGRHYRCYGVQASGLESPDKAHKSIAEMAEYYARVINHEFPEGPIFVGGWCFGGSLALETARALEALGRRPEHVLMMQSFPREESTTRRVSKLRAVLSSGRSGVRALLDGRAAASNSAAGQPEANFALEANKGFLKHRGAVLTANAQAFAAHRSQPYSGNVLLLRASTHADPREDYGWRRYVQNLEVCTVPGEHTQVLESHNGDLVTQIITEHLVPLEPSEVAVPDESMQRLSVANPMGRERISAPPLSRAG